MRRADRKKNRKPVDFLQKQIDAHADAYLAAQAAKEAAAKPPEPALEAPQKPRPVLRRHDTKATQQLLAKEKQAKRVPGLEGLDDATPASTVVGPSSRLYQGRTFGRLRPADWPRKDCILLAEFKLFEPFILLTIACMCVTMAADSPLDPPGTFKQYMLATAERTYMLIFTVELVVRVVAYGGMVYLRDGWCQLDLLTVILAWAVEFIPGFGTFDVVRALRGLRPLRGLHGIPGMPTLVQSILGTMPKVGSVLLLCGLMLLLFVSLFVSVSSLV